MRETDSKTAHSRSAPRELRWHFMWLGLLLEPTLLILIVLHAQRTTDGPDGVSGLVSVGIVGLMEGPIIGLVIGCVVDFVRHWLWNGRRRFDARVLQQSHAHAPP
jgi:hypothetical protein